jgi:PAS domain S-box-containing protein
VTPAPGDDVPPDAAPVEDWVRSSFAWSPVGMAIATLDGRFIAANPALCRALGYTEQELRRSSVADVTHPDDRELTARLLGELIEGRRDSFVVEKRYLRRDGSDLWGRSNVALGRGEDGEPRCITATTEDITEEVAAARQLEFSQSLLRVAGGLAAVGGWSVELPGRELFWSDEVYDILEVPDGYEPELARVQEIYDPDHRIAVDAALDRCIEDGTPFHLEVDATSFAGRRLRAQVVGEAQRDGDGTTRRVVGAFQDITELTAAHARAEEVADRLTTALESMTDAFYLLDTGWRFTYINRQAQQLLEVDADVLGRIVWDAFPTTVDSDLHDAYQQAVATGEPVDLEAYHYPPLDRWFKVRAYPSTQGLAVYFQDVTERRRVEAQQLRSQRLESLGTLAGGIAHDLNNVLAPILMSIDLLRDGVGPEQRELLGTLESSAQRGADMVGQVLSFARGVSGDREELDVVELVRGVLRIARETFPRNLDLVTEVEPEVAHVHGDQTQLHQVLMNLLVNARDAMSEGGTIRCAVRTTDLDERFAAVTLSLEPGRFVVIEVVDDGRGMPPEVADRIFEPFFTTKRHGEGTGLGLPTSLAIVESHGGQIRFYTERGRGTTFRVYLPAAQGTVAVRTSPAAPLPAGAGETVLVVDDEAAVLEVTERTLRHHGYRVLTARDGEEAVAIFAADPEAIDLVLTDVMMPVMDGPATVHALRRLRSDVRVIACSGLHTNGTASEVADAGVSSFLAKPYTATALLTTVREVLDGPT